MNPSIYRLRLQDILTLCVLGLLCLGILMVQSASMQVSGQVKWWQFSEPTIRHAIYAGLALITFFIVGRIDYTCLLRRGVLSNPVFWVLGAAIVSCAAVLVPGIGISVNGARRWLSLGITRVQPSEIGKWAIVLFLAWWFARRPLKLESFWFGFIPTMVPVGIVCLLVVKEDFGTAALIATCAIAMSLAGRIKLWHLMVVFPPALAAGVVAIIIEPYRLQRILAFLDPWKAPQKEGYHMIQSLLSFSTGGIFGTGLGRGIQKLGYLPEDTTDFIFSVICEELGIFGALATVALYVGILFVVWQVIRQRKEAFGQLLAFGAGAMIGLQALINIAVATVSVPPKGMSLPLVSAGGSGLVITCAALGLLMNICRQTDEQVAAESAPKVVPLARPAVAAV